MSLREIYTKDVVTVKPTATLLEAAKVMSEKHVGHLVVVDPKTREPLGVLTDRDIVRYVVASDLDAKRLKVDEIMARNPMLAFEDDGIYDIIRMMQTNGYRRLPVINTLRQLVGVVSLDDVLDLLAGELDGLAQITHRQRNKEHAGSSLFSPDRAQVIDSRL
jgi:CBS domain-containing protein